MRKFIQIVEGVQSELNAVTAQDVTDLYASGQMDLSGLVDAHQSVGTDITNCDYTDDVVRMKAILQPLDHRRLTLYRCFREQPSTTALGIHWSLWKELAGDFGNTMVTIEVDGQQVDWVGTIARGIHWWDDEQEITLLRDTPVTILKIEDVEGINPPVLGPIQGTI